MDAGAPLSRLIHEWSDHAPFRSICPGMDISRDTLFAAISSMLATLTITPPCEEHGAQRPSTLEYTGGTICQVMPFDCSIKPRSARAAALIAQVAMDVERDTCCTLARLLWSFAADHPATGCPIVPQIPLCAPDVAERDQGPGLDGGDD
jgi:hypothetical protein